jgi:Trk K+ transport system NAD-binding subunit
VSARSALIRRIKGEALYFAWAVRTLSRPLTGMLIVCTIGAVVHHQFGGHPGRADPSWSESFFVSYCLLFLEHLEPTPEHPLAQLVHYLQPLVGVFLVSEGILRLGLGLINREQNARVWSRIMASVSEGHVVVCGLGSVGFRVTEELVAMGLAVFAIESDPNGQFVERARQLGAFVVIGDARTDELLRSLNISAARAVIVATDNDLANLEIALDTREIRQDVPIVMRLFDQRLADKVKSSLGIQVSFSTSRLAAPLFATAALHRSVIGTHRVGAQVLATLELEVGDGAAFDGASVAAVSAAGGTIVASRGAGPASSWSIPAPPEQRLHKGCTVHLVVPTGRVDEFVRLATQPGPRLRLTQAGTV